MRMVLEQLGGRLVGFRAHDHEAAHLVAHVLDPALSDLLGLAERTMSTQNTYLALFLGSKTSARMKSWMAVFSGPLYSRSFIRPSVQSATIRAAA
jgi:hypothetical protein